MVDATFAEHEREQLARWARLSYAERLQWLWQAKLFALRAQCATLQPLQPPDTRAGLVKETPSSG